MRIELPELVGASFDFEHKTLPFGRRHLKEDERQRACHLARWNDRVAAPTLDLAEHLEVQLDELRRRHDPEEPSVGTDLSPLALRSVNKNTEAGPAIICCCETASTEPARRVTKCERLVANRRQNNKRLQIQWKY
jgi:hypothetical protein